LLEKPFGSIKRWVEPTTDGENTGAAVSGSKAQGAPLFKKLSAVAIVALSGCGQIQETSQMMGQAGVVKTAGVGDTVVAFNLSRSLPNIIGKADLYGRTVNAGQISVRFIGAQGQTAFFERNDVTVISNATTMTESPRVVPNWSTASMNGMIGGTPVYGTASQTGYTVLPASGSSSIATAQAPIRFPIEKGNSITINGRTLTVLAVSPAQVQYRVD
jgi:hypothetical protein